MKRNYLRLSISIVSLTLLCSCQQELLQTEQDYSQKSQQSTIQQLLRVQLEKKDPQLLSKIDKLSAKRFSVNGKIYTDTENGFSIDTEKAIYVEDANGNKTYTFKIERNNGSSGFLENLVLKQTGNSEYMAYISKYDQMAVENLGSISQSDLKNHITFTPLGTKTGTEVFGKYNADPCQVMMPVASAWVQVGGTMCYTGEHDFAHISECNYGSNINGYPPTPGYYTYEISYGSVDICGGGGFTPGNNSGGGTTPIGGGGGLNPNLPELDDVTDPCNNLKKLLNPMKANLKPLITNNMYDYINSNSPGETGIFIKKDPNGNISTELPAPSPTNHLPTPTGPNYLSGVHTHPKTTYPILSYDDIYTLYKLDHNTGVHNAGQTSVLMVCEDDAGVKQTYAIVFESTGQTLQEIWTNPENNGCPIEELLKILFKKLEKLCNEEEKKSNPDYERVFLQFIFGNNIGLYKANTDLTNWSKLTINENSDTAIVTPTNCN